MAAQFRSLLDLDRFQLDMDSASKFYAEFRRRVEELGAFVVHSSFRDRELRGVAIFDEYFTNNIIVINTLGQNHASRSFTLGHQLAHLILKNSGVSDTLRRQNEVEVFCNRFSASLLMPRNQISEILSQFSRPTDFESSISQARFISNVYKVSISASLLRMFELRHAPRDHFQQWRSLSSEENWQDSISEIRISKENKPDVGKNAIGKIGLRLASVFREALRSQNITKYDVHNVTGLSLKTIDEMTRATAEKLRDLYGDAE